MRRFELVPNSPLRAAVPAVRVGSARRRLPAAVLYPLKAGRPLLAASWSCSDRVARSSHPGVIVPGLTG